MPAFSAIVMLWADTGGQSVITSTNMLWHSPGRPHTRASITETVTFTRDHQKADIVRSECVGTELHLWMRMSPSVTMTPHPHNIRSEPEAPIPTSWAKFKTVMGL